MRAEQAEAARLLNQPFRKHARTGLPLVTLKLAMSLDGRTSTAAGDSPWISSEESRALVHRWRAESDAIAVGIGTVLADDPLLTARDAAQPASQPASSSTRSARLPLDSQLLATLDTSPVLVVVSPQADPERVAALGGAGAEPLVADGIASRPGGARPPSDHRRSSSRAARPSPPPSRTPTRSTRRGSSSPPCCSPAVQAAGQPRPPTRPTAPVGDDTLIETRFKEW